MVDIKKFKVTTKLRNGINDMQVDAIEKTLTQDDWFVKNVQVGQVFYLEAPYTAINELCEQVLVNTLLYDYEIENA